MHTLAVHLRVNDADTGQPTPVRLSITGPEGESYPPLGWPHNFPFGKGEDVGGQVWLGRSKFTYIDGGCEIRLPVGVPLSVEIEKGLEYEPIRETIQLGIGQLTLRFAIKRWHRPPAAWLAGDTRAHWLPPHTALLEGRAEGLAVVYLLAGEHRMHSQDGKQYTCVPNLLAFSGQKPCLVTEDCAVCVGTHNTHPVLGKLGLLHTHRAVFPLAFGEPSGSDDWSLSDWADQAHRKRGLVVWTDFPPNTHRGGEALACAILGQVDAIELTPASPRLVNWYRLGRVGVVVPLVGGSGKESNRMPLGALRTYALVEAGPPPPDHRWIEAVRAGRTFITNGPLLYFHADRQLPGAILERPTGCRIRVEAIAESFGPFERLELLADGEVFADSPAQVGSPYRAKIEGEYLPERSCLLSARCVGGAASLLDRQTTTFAHTSAIFIRLNGQPIPTDETAAGHFIEILEAVEEWAASVAVYEQERFRTQLHERLQASLTRLRG